MILFIVGFLGMLQVAIFGNGLGKRLSSTRLVCWGGITIPEMAGGPINKVIQAIRGTVVATSYITRKS